MPFEPIEQVTERQGEIYRYFIKHIEEFGFQPTAVEASEHFGVTPKAIRDILTQLATKGLIEFPAHRQERCITFLWVKFKAVFEGG